MAGETESGSSTSPAGAEGTANGLTKELALSDAMELALPLSETSVGPVHVPSLTFGFALAFFLGLLAQVFRGTLKALVQLIGGGLLLVLLAGSYVTWMRAREATTSAKVEIREVTKPELREDGKAQTKQPKAGGAPKSTSARQGKEPSGPSSSKKDLLIIESDDL